MKLKKNEMIKQDLMWLKNKYDAVVFGSLVEGGSRRNSDIDIAVLSYESDEKKNLEIQKELLSKFPSKYDVRVFELFPIYIQISIIKNYQVIFGDPLDISEYFYSYRKKWDDCKDRILSNQFTNYQERVSLTRSNQD